MCPYSVIVPDLRTRRGGQMRAYAEDLSGRLGGVLKAVPASVCVEKQPLPPGTILVNAYDCRRSVLTAVPVEETVVSARSESVAMIPVSNGEAGEYAAYGSLPVLRQMGFRVIVYHTTWRDSAIEDPDPSAHVCREARQVIDRVYLRAHRSFVSCETVIETAETVEDGVIRRALLERCSLIVVARGRNTGKGSYVDQWIEASPVPLLIVGRKGVRK